MQQVEDRVQESTNGRIGTDAVELNILERITLQRILPVEGDYITAKTVRDLRDAIGLSEAEIAESGITVVGDNQYSIPKLAASIMKVIPMGEIARYIVKKQLQELSTQKKLALDCVPLYERFVESS